MTELYDRVAILFTPNVWVVLAFIGIFVGHWVEELIVEPWRLRRARQVEDYE